MTDAKEQFVKNLKQTKEEREQLEEIDDRLEQAGCDLSTARREFEGSDFDAGKQSIEAAWGEMCAAIELAESI